MELNKLNRETNELVANSLGVYYALLEKDKLYRQENMAIVSLYGGVLRMNRTIMDGSYIYNNITREILNEYGITIEKVIDLLNLDKKLSYSVNARKNTKLERQYNTAYRNLLHIIRNYYVASARITKNDDKAYIPIKMTIPNIISAIHYSNIDPYNSIWNLNCRLGNLTDSINIKPEHLNEIEKHSTYKDKMARYDKKTGEIKDIYQIEKPLIMNKSLGRII